MEVQQKKKLLPSSLYGSTLLAKIIDEIFPGFILIPGGYNSLQISIDICAQVLLEQQIDLSEGAAAHSYKQKSDSVANSGMNGIFHRAKPMLDISKVEKNCSDHVVINRFPNLNNYRKPVREE